jgi:UDP-N-acetylmuramoyl-L-alanyl-D-glutamate--2,6-diaminopimelate ligase
MRVLRDILYKVPVEEISGTTNLAITEIAFDSRKVKKDGLFVAVRGTNSDGHEYISAVVKAGVKAVVCEQLPEQLEEGVTYVKVSNARLALAMMASAYYDHPSAELKVVAVTGTNGKTTVASLLYQLFTIMGYEVGLLSTVVNRIGNKALEATHTTPDPISLQSTLRMMVDKGCKFCFMEASSHALDQDRMAGVQLAGAAFTNLTHDHLDYHKTFNEYLKAKKRLFDQLNSKAFALMNADDKYAEHLLHHCKAKVHYYSLRTDADFKGKVLDNAFEGLHMTLNGKELYSRLIGSFNAYNLLAVAGIAILLGQEEMNVLTGISSVNSAEGRFQYFRTPKQVTAIVDYAHTPDALANVLSTINDLRQKGQRIITVVGCGGDRDKTKRPEMARIAVSQSDKVFLSSDNPRSESPEEIIEQMRKGVPAEGVYKVLSITDRREAIRAAAQWCEPGDIVLVAGKGHEKYQEIQGVKHPFDDYQILQEAFKEIR